MRSQALSHLAFVQLYQGSEEEAVRLADRAVRLYTVSLDAWFGPRRVVWQAHVYTVVGHHDETLDRLRYPLSIPADLLTVPQLRMDPRWDPLRDHPGCQKLAEEQQRQPGA